MKRIIKSIIETILILILIFSLYKIGSKVYLYIKDKETYSSIREEYGSKYSDASSKISIGIDDKNLLQERFNLLKEKNDDYKLWITLEGTNIDYPVVQGQDNDFYLNNDFNKKESISGSIFIDYRANIDEDKNIIIYAHNMRNKEMFNNLGKYRDEEFFQNNTKIIVTDNKEIEEYEIFSVYIEDAYDIYKENIEEDFEAYINEIKNKSLYKNNIEVTEKDKLITLVTCSFEYEDARIVVWSRKKN